MRWFNHMACAGATCAVVNPALVPIAMLGSTAPDWLEWIANALGYHVKHRTITHYFTVWLIGWIGFAVLEPTGIIAAFCYGGFTHVFVDAMTIAGVPFSPISDRRFHLFGGRLRTGDPAEYGISFGVVAICAVIVMMLSASGWYPFFYNWSGLYNSGVIDGFEWYRNRFRFF